MCRFPARTDTDDLATTDDPPPAPMRWLNLHCGVKWTFSGDDFWRRKELPSLFSCTITCKMLWIACVPSVLFQYGRKQRSLQQLMTLPPPTTCILGQHRLPCWSLTRCILSIAEDIACSHCEPTEPGGGKDCTHARAQKACGLPCSMAAHKVDTWAA